MVPCHSVGMSESSPFLASVCNYYCCIPCVVEDWESDPDQWTEKTKDRACWNYCCCHNKCCCKDGGTQVNGCGGTSDDNKCCKRCFLWSGCCCNLPCTTCTVRCYEQDWRLADKSTTARCFCSTFIPCGMLFSACLWALRPSRPQEYAKLGDTKNGGLSRQEDVKLIAPKLFVA